MALLVCSISVTRFAHRFENDAVSSRASGLHQARGQRPRQTLQPFETWRDVYFQVHREYSRREIIRDKSRRHRSDFTTLPIPSNKRVSLRGAFPENGNAANTNTISLK